MRPQTSPGCGWRSACLIPCSSLPPTAATLCETPFPWYVVLPYHTSEGQIALAPSVSVEVWHAHCWCSLISWCVGAEVEYAESIARLTISIHIATPKSLQRSFHAPFSKPWMSTEMTDVITVKPIVCPIKSWLAMAHCTANASPDCLRPSPQLVCCLLRLCRTCWRFAMAAKVLYDLLQSYTTILEAILTTSQSSVLERVRGDNFWWHFEEHGCGAGEGVWIQRCPGFLLHARGRLPNRPPCGWYCHQMMRMKSSMTCMLESSGTCYCPF